MIYQFTARSRRNLCRLLLLDVQSVFGWQRNVLAAAAADTDEHLSIGTPVTLADGCVYYPRSGEVERPDGGADTLDGAGDGRVVTDRCQNAANMVREAEDDDCADDGCSEVGGLELSTTGLERLPLLFRRQPR